MFILICYFRGFSADYNLIPPGTETPILLDYTPTNSIHEGIWYVDFASNNFGVWDNKFYGYGPSTSHPVPADYDGDGKADLSVKTDTGYWYIDYAINGFGAWDVTYSGYGPSTSHPVPADYDGDGKADLSVKTDTGYWYIDYANNGFGAWDVIYSAYGSSTSHPVPADYDGDGKADLSAKTDTGYWYIDYANNGFGAWDVSYSGYGPSTSHPVPADYDGDGKADLSVKTDTGYWYIDYANNGFGAWDVTYSGYGPSTSHPVPADYDGDNKVDLSVTTPKGKMVSVNTKIANYYIYSEENKIDCFQKIGIYRKNLEIKFYNNILNNISIKLDESTDGYLIYENDNIRIAFHSDGTMWIKVKLIGEQIDFISNITRDYDKGGGKRDNIYLDDSHTDVWDRCYKTNWMIISDEPGSDVKTNGGFGVYVRPFKSQINNTAYFPRMLRNTSDENRVTLITNDANYNDGCNFIVSLFPTKGTSHLEELKKTRLLRAQCNSIVKKDPGDVRRIDVYDFPDVNELKCWAEIDNYPYRYDNSDKSGFRFYAPQNTKPIPVNTLLLFEEIWQFASENISTEPDNIGHDNMATAFVPYQTPYGTTSDDILNSFLTTVNTSFPDLKVLVYISFLDFYNQLPRLASTYKTGHTRTVKNPYYTVTEDEYFNLVKTHIIDMLFTKYNISGFYIDTYQMDGEVNPIILEPMILAYRIMRYIKANYPNKMIIVHCSENPIGPTRIWGHMSMKDPERWDSRGLAQVEIYAPFIDRYADILCRGEAYPIDIALNTDNTVKNYVSEHIKYVVNPFGKSNCMGFNIVWKFTKWPNQSGHPFSGENYPQNTFETPYFNWRFPISIEGGASRTNYRQFITNENSKNDFLINKLVIMNKIYDNYLKPGYLLLYAKGNQYNDKFERRISYSRPGPGEASLPDWDINTGFRTAFGPNNDYYRSVQIVWPLFSDPKKYLSSFPYTIDFESGKVDDYWILKTESEDGRVQITTSNSPHSGNKHLTMDVSSNGHYSTNEAWLHLDLNGESQVEMKFWWKDFGDENHSNDGIYFSDDGGDTFKKVYELKPQSYSNNYWRKFSLDVDELASTNDLELTNNFVIKFQQYDNYKIPSDGFAFDDISISVDYPLDKPISDLQEKSDLPKSFELFQNYPNPFNPTTTINYSLKEDVDVKIIIYNILGQEVKTLINVRQTAGYKSVVWNGTNQNGDPISNGMYIYKIIAGDFVKVRKMILIR
jgi:hypothetical protein